MRKSVKVIITIISLVSISFLVLFIYTLKYVGFLDNLEDVNINDEKLENLSQYFKQKDYILASDFFDFNFNKGYIMNDNYIDGDTFAKRYKLDIKIPEVREALTDRINRIVFVDEKGNFVNLFRYFAENVKVYDQGMIIYPTTKIIKLKSSNEKLLKLKFDSEDYYYDKEEYKEYYRKNLYERLLKETFKDKNEVLFSELFQSSKQITGYIIKGGELSGDEFADKYNLKIFVSEVEKESNNNIYRIIFVDDDGYYHSEVQYSAERVLLESDGMIINKNTKITMIDNQETGTIILKFDSNEYYNK